VQNIVRKVDRQSVPPNSSNFVDLYRDGSNVYEKFHAFIEKAVENAAKNDPGSLSGSINLGLEKMTTPYAICKRKDGNRRARMKGIYRVLEKALFKYNKPVLEQVLKDHIDIDLSMLDFSKVLDLVRGAILCSSMEALADIAEYIFRSNEVCLEPER